MKLRELLQRRPPASSPTGAARSPGVEFLTRITDELAHGPLNLPCFPDVVPRVRKALDDPRSKVDDIVRIAGTEPRLAARLLQTANSVVFNPAGKPAPHLRGAITRLGQQAVQSVAMVFAIQQMKAEPTLRPVAKPLHDLWERSIAVASICEVVARQLHVPTDKVFLTGLLHGIGHFYIIVRAAEASSEVAYDQLPGDLLAAWHPSIGQAVLAKWGFEAVVCEAVGRQNDHARQSQRAADLTDVLIASVVLAEALLDHNGDLARSEGVTAFARLGLGPAELQAVLTHTEHSLGSLRQALAV
jgi:HD-like signal output (HDOD) protein